jgi:hypothetical protein
MLDDLEFTKYISDNGLIQSIIHYWRFEGRSISPFVILHYILIYILKSNQLILFFYVTSFFILILYQFKNYILVIAIGILVFIAQVRGVAYETIFWQSGVVYFFQLLFFILMIKDYHYYSKRKWYLILLGFCTYQISAGALLFILLNDLMGIIKFKSIEHFTWNNFVRYFFILIPVIIMIFLSPNERLVHSNINISLNLFSIGKNMYLGLWEFWQDWKFLILTIFFLSFYSLGRKVYNEELLLKAIFILITSFVTFLPNVVLHQFQQRNSLYFGILFCLGSFLVLNYFWFKIVKIEKKLLFNKLNILFCCFIFIYNIFQMIILTKENREFNFIYGDRLLLYSSRVEKVKILKLKHYCDSDLKKYFGYSDGYMLSKSWVQEIYKNQYNIECFKTDGSYLLVKYKSK